VLGICITTFSWRRKWGPFAKCGLY